MIVLLCFLYCSLLALAFIDTVPVVNISCGKINRKEMVMGRTMAICFMLGAVASVWGCGDDDEEDIDENRRDDAWQLEIDLDGSLQNAAWSPDGDAIVFTNFRENYNEEPADLYIADAEDGAVSELVNDGSGNVNLPGSAWSAAAEIIVFSSSGIPTTRSGPSTTAPGPGTSGKSRSATNSSPTSRPSPRTASGWSSSLTSSTRRTTGS